MTAASSRCPRIALPVVVACLAFPGVLRAQGQHEPVSPGWGAIPTLPERDYSNVPHEVRPARLAEEGVRAAIKDGRAPFAFPVLDSVLFDEPGDGAIWVLGRSYKARIDSAGLTYIPFFGSRAPRNFPMAFKLRSASIGEQDLPLADGAAPVRDEQRVYVLHGSVTEVLDFALDSVEQSFVVERGEAIGELDLQLDVETDMTRANDASGEWFQTPHGSVHYGLPKTVDADGLELTTSTLRIDRGMEFTVSADEVARAKGDLTIDPIIATLTVDSSVLDDREPDVAYDVTNDRYIVVYERIYSQTDHDALCQMLQGATGQVIANTWSYIDFTSDDWRQLSVANLNGQDQFLVAASVGPAPEVIKCRTRSAGSLTMGNQLTISAGADGQCSLPPPQVVHHCRAPVVGGDPWPGSPSFYCVAWINHDIIPDHGYCDSVYSAVVSSAGWSSVPQLINNPTVPIALTADDGTWPSLSISKSDGDTYSGASQDWNLVWRGMNDSCSYSSGGNTTFVYSGQAIMGVRIHWNGSVSSPPTVLMNPCTPIPGISFVASRISVSTSEANSTRRFLVTWDFGTVGSTSRLYGALVNPSVGWGVQPASAIYDLTQLQGNPGAQWQPSVDCDGTNYVVAFNAYPGGTIGLAAAEFGFNYHKYYGWFFACVEPQVQVWISNQQMGRARICGEASGAGARRNALIGGTNWAGYGSGGYYLGDPVVGLHAH
jgi:hypothetical protein